MYPNIDTSIMHNSQDMEATKVSLSKWMDKEDVIYIYTMEYYSVLKIVKFCSYDNLDGPGWYYS